MDKLQEHLDWLDRIHAEGSISSEVMSESKIILNRIIEDAKLREPPIPCACTGPDGQILYSWDKDEHHLELEIIPKEWELPQEEFFYRNRNTKHYWSDSLSPKVIEIIRLINKTD